MASRIGFAALAVVLAVAAPAMAANFDVGGSTGWTNSGSYDSWVAGNTFSAGDTLTFKYDPTHSVVQVASKADYDGCNTGNALKTDSTSPSVFTLDKAGTTYYYVCGTISHCMSGMKLSLTTAGSGGGGSTPSTPTTPATPSTPTGTPPSTPTTTPAPKPSAASTVTGTAAAVAGALAAALLA